MTDVTNNAAPYVPRHRRFEDIMRAVYANTSNIAYWRPLSSFDDWFEGYIRRRFRIFSRQNNTRVEMKEF